MSVQVADVPQALSQVRAVAEGLGGFVENLNSSGGEGQPQYATVTVRVPQDQFFTAVERISVLGEVQNQNLGSEDVTEQFIDLKARLQSAQREELSLLSLLEKADTVSDILVIERELTRLRSEIERLQGQINFLERRLDLATISVSLAEEFEDAGTPPSASLTLGVPAVDRSVDEVKALVSSLNGVVDGVFFSKRGDDERAEVSLRVFATDFTRVLAAMERMGDVRSKEVTEGTPPSADAKPPEKPNAYVQLSLARAEESNAGLIAAIVVPSVAAGILAVLAAFRYGRRRSGGGRLPKVLNVRARR
ncbi:MAG: DUF4349 domain-containing protein [Dehalococcoidia bacterium]|nr:DUF4349 domain-containing protein [Dehalococcoidia bacterium]